MRARKLSFSGEMGKSIISPHLSFTDPAGRKKLTITSDGVTRFNQQIDRFSDLINAVNPCPVLT